MQCVIADPPWPFHISLRKRSVPLPQHDRGPNLRASSVNRFLLTQKKIYAILTNFGGRFVQLGLTGLNKIPKVDLKNPRILTKWEIFEYRN